MLVHLINLVSAVLGNGAVACRIRALALRLLGNQISLKARVSNSYVYGGKLSVGPGSFIGRGAYFDLSESVTIEQDVVVGHGVTFITANHEIGPADRRCGAVIAQPIRVGRGAWVAANVTVMPGVKIGEGAVVAAGALILHDVEPHIVVGGVPARLLRPLS